MEEILEKIQQQQNYYDTLPKQILEVEIHLSMGFASTFPLHLDALLAYQSMLNLIPDLFHSAQYEPGLEPPLPLEKRENENNWWWAASAAKYDLDYEGIVRWKKRWDEDNEDLLKKPEKKKFRVNHKSGFFKAYDMPMVVKICRSLLFCCVGNQCEIEKLLAGITNIGKKRSQGLGEVKKITIHAAEKDWSNWDGNIVTRAIPAGPQDINLLLQKTRASGQSNLHLTLMGFRPPYWHPNNRAMCFSF